MMLILKHTNTQVQIIKTLNSMFNIRIDKSFCESYFPLAIFDIVKIKCCAFRSDINVIIPLISKVKSVPKYNILLVIIMFVI